MALQDLLQSNTPGKKPTVTKGPTSGLASLLVPQDPSRIPVQPTPEVIPEVVPPVPEKSQPFFSLDLTGRSALADKPILKKVSLAGASLVQNLASIPKAVVNIKDVITGQSLDQNRFVDRLAATGEEYNRVITERLGGANTFGDKLAQGGGSFAANLFPAAGVGKFASAGVNILSKSPKIAKYAPLVGTLTAQGVLTGAESSQEAGQTYSDVLLKTRDPQLAQDRAESVFGANVVLGALTNKFSRYFEVLDPGAKNVLKRVVSAFAFEGGQEGGQQMIGNLGSDRPVFEGVTDAALIGGILGSGGTLATANIFNKDGSVNKEKVIEHLNEVQAKPITFEEEIQTPTQPVTPESVTPPVEVAPVAVPESNLQPAETPLTSKLEPIVNQPTIRLVSENVTENKTTEYDPNTQIKIGDAIVPRPDKIVGKTQIKELLKGLKKDEINLTIGERNGKKTLEYNEGNTNFFIYPKALGLVENDNLKLGDVVSVNKADFETKGIARDTSIRAVDQDGVVLASRTSPARSNSQKSKTTLPNKPSLLPRGSMKIDQFEKLAPRSEFKSNEEFKIYENVAALIKKYATRISEGNVQRGASGTFNTKTHTIRIRGLNNFSTAVHEITHQLDVLNNVTDGNLSKEGYKMLEKVYLENYVGAKKSHDKTTKKMEGYAVLLQRFVEAPTYTKELYPEAVKEFLTPGGEFYKPVIGDIIKDVQASVAEYQSLDPLAQIGARVTQDNNVTGKDSFLNIAEKVHTQAADAVYPIQKLSVLAGAKGQERPDLIIRHYSNVNSYFANNVTGKDGYWSYQDGEFKKTHDFNWGTLIKDLEKSKKRKDFDFFLVARRNYFDHLTLKKLRAENSLSEVSNPDLDNQIDELSKILNNDMLSESVAAEAYLTNKDRFVKEEKQFDALTQSDLDLMHDKNVGLLNDEEYNKLTSREGYASFKREFYNEIVGDEGVAGKAGKTGKVSTLKARKGSSRTIISPILSGVKAHGEVLQKSMRQVVNNKMVQLVKSGKVDDFMEVVPVVSSVDADGKVSFPQEKDPTIIMGRINGKRVAVQTDAFIKNTLESVLDYNSVGVMEKALSASSRMFTKGTTSSFPLFALVNFPIDQFTASSNTQTKFVPFVSPLKNLYKAVIKREGKDYEYFREYLTLVGDRLAIGKQNEMSANELSDYLTGERKGILRAIDAINKGLDIIAIPGQFSESLTRGTEYVAARKEGKSQVEAMDMAAEVSTNFSRIGRLGGTVKQGTQGFGKNFVRSIPYFNAGIQVTNKTARQLRTPAGRKRVGIVVAAVTAANVAALALLISQGTEEQKEIYKDLEGSMLSKYLYLPASDGKTLTKIRMPDIMLMPSAVINMLIAEKYLGIDYSQNSYTDAMTAFIPGPINPFKPAEAIFGALPQLVKPAISIITNKTDFPRIRPLEGQGQQRKPAGERFTPSTPVLNIKLGKMLGISPIKIDAFVTGYFGRVSGYATGKPGIYNPESIFAQKAYFEGGRRMQEYFAIKEEADQQYTFRNISDKKKAGKELTEEERKVNKIHKIINGYTPNDIDGVKEDAVKGIEDYRKDYQKAVDKEDNEKANEIAKKITEKVEELKKYAK